MVEELERLYTELEKFCFENELEGYVDMSVKDSKLNIKISSEVSEEHKAKIEEIIDSFKL